MSSLLVRWRLRTSRVLTFLLAAVSLTTACAKSPAEPSSAATTPTPNVSIVSMVVASETLVSGAHVYRVTVKLRESGGAAATIASIDLTFMNGSSWSLRRMSNTHFRHREHPRCQRHDGLARDHDDRRRSIASACHQRGRESQLHVWRLADAQCRRIGRGATVGRADLHAVWRRDRREHGREDGRRWDGPGRRRGERGEAFIDRWQRRLHPDGSDGGSFSIRATASGYNATERAVTVAQDTRLDSKLQRTTASPPPPPPPPSPGACGTPSPRALTRWLQGWEFYRDDFENRRKLLVAGKLRCELDHIPRRNIWKQQRHAELCRSPSVSCLHAPAASRFPGWRQRPTSSAPGTIPTRALDVTKGPETGTTFQPPAPVDGTLTSKTP